MPVPSTRLPIVFAFTALLTVASGSTALAAGPITGRIVDSDGRSMRARVLLVSGPAVSASTETNIEGEFSLTAPAEGTYELRAAAEGFRAEPRTITVTSSPLDLGTITLQVSAIAESVLVSAAQVDVPSSAASSAVTIITGEELRIRQHETVADALRSVPGLLVVASGGRGALTSVFPRGGESDYTLVFVDGVQANNFGGGFDFAHLPVANIDRIEIVRGPQSALYGANAIGSVVRIVTRRGGPPVVEGSIEGGSFDTMRLSAGSAGGVGSWQWSATGERLTSDGMNGETAGNGEPIVNDQYERSTAAASAAWTGRTGATVRGGVRYSQDERGAPGPYGLDPGGSFFGINPNAVGSNDRWLSALGAAFPIGTAMRTQALVTHARTDGTFTDKFGDVVSISETMTRRTTGRFQLDGTISESLEASGGVELLRERGGSTFISSNGTEVPVERSLAGIFGEARWSHDARVFVTAGLRVERIARDALAQDLAGFAARPDLPPDVVVSANPKVTAGWYVRSSDGDFTRVRGSAGTGIRPPDAFELAFTDNPELKPERSRSFDVGLDQAMAKGRILIESTAFFNRFDDLIITVGSFSESSRYRSDNISNARSQGLELAGTVRGRVDRADVQARVGYTLLDTEILAADGGSSAPLPLSVGDRLLRRPQHQVSLDLTVRAGRAAGFLKGGGRSEVRDIDPSLGSFGGLFDAAGYMVWDAGASFTVFPRAEVIARVTNLFDRQYEEVLGYPALGRGVYVGLRVAARR